MPLEDHKGEATKGFADALQRESAAEPATPVAKTPTVPDTTKPPAPALSMEPPGMARTNVSNRVGSAQPEQTDRATPELQEEFVKRMMQRGQDLHEMDRQSIRGRASFNHAARGRDGRERD